MGDRGQTTKNITYGYIGNWRTSTIVDSSFNYMCANLLEGTSRYKANMDLQVS